MLQSNSPEHFECPVTGLTKAIVTLSDNSWHITTQSKDPGRECNKQLRADEEHRIYAFMEALREELKKHDIACRRVDDHTSHMPVVYAVDFDPAAQDSTFDKINNAIGTLIIRHDETHHYHDKKGAHVAALTAGGPKADGGISR